ncbi:MAG: hypothetical protein KF861_23725 [Planctomycetaceae bacterium]|nr:hypothetical protein [Planctomycetaceae bacterium]
MLTLPRKFLLMAVVACLLAIPYSAQADMQDDFFRAIQSGEIKQTIDHMRPELVKEIDQPVFQAWMNAINERLGGMQSIKPTGLEIKQTPNGTMRTTSAMITFDKGTASSSLTTLGGKLIAFNITSDQLGDDWFQGPTSTDLYQQLGRTFIERFLKGETDEAYAMCHEALQEVIDRDAFQQMINIVQGESGALKSVTFRESKMDITEDDGQNLMLNFDIVSEKGTATCEIKVQFVGMKGHLLGFQFE